MRAQEACIADARALATDEGINRPKRIANH
jgi:hypothetical protein